MLGSLLILVCVYCRLYMLGNHIFMTEEQLLLSRAMRRLFPWKTCKTVPRPQVSITSCKTNSKVSSNVQVWSGRIELQNNLNKPKYAFNAMVHGLNEINGQYHKVSVVQSLCPQNQFQAWVFDLVTKPHFEMVMVAVICLNILCMAVESDDQSMLAVEVLYFLHFSFLIIFLLEFVIKVIALRKHYFQDYWNVADFIILVTCIAGKLFSCLTSLSCCYTFKRIRNISIVRLKLNILDFETLEDKNRCSDTSYYLQGTKLTLEKEGQGAPAVSYQVC